MELSSSITEHELRQVLEKGFVVKEEIPFWRILCNIPFLLLAPVISIGIMIIPAFLGLSVFPGIFSGEYIGIKIGVFLLIPWILILIKILYDYIFFGKKFYYQYQYVIRELHPQHGSSFKIGYTFYGIIKNRFLEILKSTTILGKMVFLVPGLIGILALPGAIILIYPNYFFLSISLLFALLIISAFFRFIVEKIHPLYAFGNIGEKIQKLTPSISDQSNLIQSEFQKEQNFSVLRSGFEKLSVTFARIVDLVVKLEKVEARANKGNLFDSAKYIGSLRADVVTPLVELQKFLEKQRVELLESQRELSRVRVGGDPERSSEPVLNSFQEGQEQIELQSKRSEELLQELDTNIGKLREMVEKMG